MVSTLNLNDMDGVVRVVRHALMGTFLIEGTGAVVLTLCFLPRYGFLKGLWRGIFHAVSAFCNAGFDLLGTEGEFSSLASYNGNPVVLLTIMALITIGGLGFFVWEDILALRKRPEKTLPVQQDGTELYRRPDPGGRALFPAGGVGQSCNAG